MMLLVCPKPFILIYVTHSQPHTSVFRPDFRKSGHVAVLKSHNLFQILLGSSHNFALVRKMGENPPTLRYVQALP